MIITCARYTVQATYTETNIANIKQVMKEIQALGRDDLHYSTYLEEDGKTFVHLFSAQNEEARTAFRELEAFQSYQRALLQREPEVMPQLMPLSLVADSTVF